MGTAASHASSRRGTATWQGTEGGQEVMEKEKVGAIEEVVKAVAAPRKEAAERVELDLVMLAEMVKHAVVC